MTVARSSSLSGEKTRVADSFLVAGPRTVQRVEQVCLLHQKAFVPSVSFRFAMCSLKHLIASHGLKLVYQLENMSEASSGTLDDLCMRAFGDLGTNQVASCLGSGCGWRSRGAITKIIIIVIVIIIKGNYNSNNTNNSNHNKGADGRL